MELKSRQVISLRQGTDPQWILTADYVSMVSSMSFLADPVGELESRAKYFRCGIGSDPQWILMADYGKDGSHGVFDFSLCGEPNITTSEISWSLSHVPLSTN